jgi:hypothetical protein
MLNTDIKHKIPITNPIAIFDLLTRLDSREVYSNKNMYKLLIHLNTNILYDNKLNSGMYKLLEKEQFYNISKEFYTTVKVMYYMFLYISMHNEKIFQLLNELLHEDITDLDKKESVEASLYSMLFPYDLENYCDYSVTMIELYDEMMVFYSKMTSIYADRMIESGNVGMVMYNDIYSDTVNSNIYNSTYICNVKRSEFKDKSYSYNTLYCLVQRIRTLYNCILFYVLKNFDQYVLDYIDLTEVAES